ncbi:hypothetical protein Lal_00012401 [Lupinus albus]|nr:hypothetical protein Lal_00012401 [Lupinus albus]
MILPRQIFILRFNKKIPTYKNNKHDSKSYEVKFSYKALVGGGGFPLFNYLNKVYDRFEERLEIQVIPDDITSKYVPSHVNKFYCLGGITFTCFLVHVAT